MTKLSSLDSTYTSGDLSAFPDAIDSKADLYFVKNNAATTLKQSLLFGSKQVIVEDASGFPDVGLIHVSNGRGQAELIYYGAKTGNIFSDLTRGFAGSIRSKFLSGSAVTGSVMADQHNIIKDAILNIQEKVGLRTFPDTDSMNGQLKQLEDRFLAPQAKFRAYPRVGAPELSVRFQNFTIDPMRSLWDFGDGSSSIETSPNHTYVSEGTYTVRLNVITSAGAQGVATKTDYIVVSNDKKPAFFYAVQDDTSLPAYSQDTADALVLSSADPTATAAVFNFVDQSGGDITHRFWVFDDGDTETVTNPDDHTTQHVYQEAGTYNPSLILIMEDSSKRRVFLQQELIVL